MSTERLLCARLVLGAILPRCILGQRWKMQSPPPPMQASVLGKRLPSRIEHLLTRRGQWRQRERPVTHTTQALGKDMKTVGNSQESRMTWQDMKTLPAPEGSGDSQGCAACPCEWLRPAFQQLPLWTGWFSSPRTDAGCGHAIWVIHASTAETPKRHFPRKRGQYLPGLLKAPD